MRVSGARAAALCANGLRDERGFTTAGSAVALLLALSLLMSAAQVQRIAAVSAEVQDVADAAALAAQNELAEFMTVVRVCDAVALTMSLAGVVATGLGVAALCCPPASFAAQPLLSAGRDVLKARDAFMEKAQAGLERLQQLLPFFAAANALAVAQANSADEPGRRYLALAFLCPGSASEVRVEPFGEGSAFAEDAWSQADGIQDAAARAEELAQQASAIKEQAFKRDCGDAPGYCMQERAASLAGLSAAENPLYRSVDSWSFEVALKRAQSYYRARLDQERPESDSVDEQARSQLRTRFYRFACDELAQGFVREEVGSFEALFPRLPRSTDEMRRTSLYTEAVYPVSEGASGRMMHAWDGCPQAQGAVERGSVADMERQGMAECPVCRFSAASLGKVAAASTSVDNGFEFHYAAVADAAEAYERAAEELEPLVRQVKEQAGGLLEQVGDLAGKAAASRIEVSPPGVFGSVVFVASVEDMPADSGAPSAFVSAGGTLGMRAAVSAASLLADEADSEGDVLSSLLDGLGDGSAAGAFGVALDVWSGLLEAYGKGQDALDGAVGDALSELPLSSASGLGQWASGALRDAVAAAGLEPVDLSALKPVLVNSAHVALRDNTTFSAQLLSIKRQAIENPQDSTGALSSVIGSAEEVLAGTVGSFSDGIDIAEIELFEGGPSISIKVALPPAVAQGAGAFIHDAADALRDVAASVSGVRPWE